MKSPSPLLAKKFKQFEGFIFLCKTHHNEVAFTTDMCHSDMGWIWLMRIESIIFGDNYLHRWFSIHPALPHLHFSSELTESCHFILEVCMLIPEETIVPQITHKLCSLFQARIVGDPHFTLLKWFTGKLIN